MRSGGIRRGAALAVVLVLVPACSRSGSSPILDGEVAQADGNTPFGDGSGGEADAAISDDGAAPTFVWEPYPGAIDPSWLHQPPACAPTDWLAKYLRYRIRLRGDGTAANPGFLSVGPATGQSIPASKRNPTSVCASDWWMNDAHCQQLNLPGTQGRYEWGDSTIWLGYYFAYLASEYAAFELLGLDLAETTQDLYYALQAFNRLDIAAEANPPYNLGSTPPNGFFQRDDVPGDFVLLTHDPNTFRFPRDDGFLGYGCLSSSASCGIGVNNDLAHGFYASEDQIVGLIFGLSLISKLIPDDLTYLGLGLKQEACAITDRIVTQLIDHGWWVEDIYGDHPPNEWGGYALPYSNQIAKGANYITAHCGSTVDYRNVQSMVEGQAIWDGVMVSWALQSYINKSMAVKAASYANEWDAEKMAERAGSYGAPGFAYVYSLLYDQPLGSAIASWEIDSMLTSAPCGGPCEKMPGCESAPGWKGEDRWKSPEDRNGSWWGNYGEYNGMDYMTLHNVYLLYRAGTYSYRAPAATSCASFGGLDAIIADGPAGTASYDPKDPCTMADMNRTFCGRTWAAWLEAAYRNDVTIFTGGARWSCSGTEPCALLLGADGGTAGHDLFIGTDADDSFYAGEGNDCLYGLGGDDTLEGGQGRDELQGGEGNDALYGESASAIVLDGDMDALFGGPGHDLLAGGPGSDDLFGEDGDDSLYGGNADDFLEGGPGNDFLNGEAGDDGMSGDDGDDELQGGDGKDRMNGGPGRDKLAGGRGDDRIEGGEGPDFLKGDDGDDSLVGGDASDDRLCGGCGKDTLWAGWFDADECRDQGRAICLSDETGELYGCETMIDQDQCNDSDFNDW